MQRIGELLHQRQIVRFLDAASDRYDDFGGAEIDGALRFAEQLHRFRPDVAWRELRRECLDLRRSCYHLVGTPRACLKRCEVRCVAGETNVHTHLALKQLPDQDKLTVVDAMRHHVADGQTVE